LGGKLGEFGLQIGTKTYFHRCRLRLRRSGVNR
jgi:hypothetical protein